MKRAWSASEQAVSSKKTRPLIGQPAKSANQRPYFLVGKSLNICPLCSFQKTVTLVSICVFSTEEVHNHTGFIWNVMYFHPLTTQISLLKQRVAPFTANEITVVGNQFGVKVLIYLWKIYCYEILAFLFHLKKDE